MENLMSNKLSNRFCESDVIASCKKIRLRKALATFTYPMLKKNAQMSVIVVPLSTKRTNILV